MPLRLRGGLHTVDVNGRPRPIKKGTVAPSKVRILLFSTNVDSNWLKSIKKGTSARCMSKTGDHLARGALIVYKFSSIVYEIVSRSP